MGQRKKCTFLSWYLYVVYKLYGVCGICAVFLGARKLYRFQIPVSEKFSYVTIYLVFFL